MKKNVLPFLALAALPAVALAILALFGARAEVGVVMTGSGPNVVLGAAWVACWLAALVVSPIALGAAAISRLDPGGPSPGMVKILHHLRATRRPGSQARW